MAVWLNAGLLGVALIGPRMVSDGGMDAAAAAALWFVVPMTLILVIGAAAAIYAYSAARSQNRRMPRAALLPLGVFLAGVAATLAMVFLQTV